MAVCPLPPGRAADTDCRVVKDTHPAIPPLYGSLTGALVMGIVGGLALLVHQPWLFPSLGPTIFLQTVSPNEPSSRPFHILAGHAVGLVAGFAALALCGALHDPSALAGGVLTGRRALATALAVGLTIAGQRLISAEHPPAAATTMLITLGGMKPSMQTIIAVVAGVGLVAALGEAARRMHPHRQEPDR
jgi:CBS-domain-containing membrane protein